MTQEMLFSKYAEQYPLTVPQEAVENELQLLILEEKQRIQYETLTGFAVHLSPQEELNKKMEALQAEALRRFLGEDLAMLQSDLKKRKAAAWACEQMAAAG